MTLKDLDTHCTDKGPQLRGGPGELGLGVRVFDDAAAGPRARGKAVSGNLGTANGNHVFAVAGGVRPAHSARVEAAVGFGGADEGFGGRGRRSADSGGGVAAHGEL